MNIKEKIVKEIIEFAKKSLSFTSRNTYMQKDIRELKRQIKK